MTRNPRTATSTHLSRRTFLKTAGALGVLSASAPGLSSGIYAAGSDTIKVALIGAGGRGTGAAAQLLNADKGVRLIAVADAFENRAQSAAQRLKKQFPEQVDLPAERIFVGLLSFQDALAAGPDLVVLASPPGFRPMHYRAAVEAGKHVFMEKPCCVDAAGYRSLMETNKLADEKGLFVAVGLQRRHEPRYIETIKRIQDGAIGRIQFLRVYWNGSGIWNRPREPGMTEMQYQVHNWYHFCWLSGDNIVEQHIHNLDVANWVLGDQHPVEANGMGGCTARYLGEFKGTGQIFDHHFVEFTYADGTKVYSQCRHMKNCFNQVAEFAHGESGVADCSGRIDQGGKTVWKYEGPRPNGHQQEQIDLVAALRAGKRYNEGYIGANSSMTAVLGRAATYSGRVVRWDELVEKGGTQFPKVLSWDAPAPVVKDAEGNYPIPMPGVYDPFA